MFRGFSLIWGSDIRAAGMRGAQAVINQPAKLQQSYFLWPYATSSPRQYNILIQLIVQIPHHKLSPQSNSTPTCIRQTSSLSGAPASLEQRQRFLDTTSALPLNRYHGTRCAKQLERGNVATAENCLPTRSDGHPDDLSHSLRPPSDALQPFGFLPRSPSPSPRDHHPNSRISSSWREFAGKSLGVCISLTLMVSVNH